MIARRFKRLRWFHKLAVLASPGPNCDTRQIPPHYEAELVMVTPRLGARLLTTFTSRISCLQFPRKQEASGKFYALTFHPRTMARSELFLAVLFTLSIVHAQNQCYTAAGELAADDIIPCGSLDGSPTGCCQVKALSISFLGRPTATEEDTNGLYFIGWRHLLRRFCMLVSHSAFRRIISRLTRL